MDSLGNCPICEREMLKGPFSDKHHFLPKCKGGKETEHVHRVCHNKIHSVFTESELAKKYNDPGKVREHPEMQKFIEWVKNKEPNFYDRNERHTRKRR